MKKFLLAFALIATVFTTAQAQHTGPRLKYESHTLDNFGNFQYNLNYITDGSGATDTVFISPDAWQTSYKINDGDTLNGTLVIDLATVTRLGVRYTKANCWELDNLSIIYTESVVAKTIKLVGAFGVGGATYTITTGTTNGKLTKTNYVFDGANFIVQ